MKKPKFLLFCSLFLLAACSYLPENNQDVTGTQTRETRKYIEILPSSGAGSTTGLILYPGGLVDAHAYMELASLFALSGSGHHVIIAKMPANLAVLNTMAAISITDEFPEKDWVIGGHSLGGAMACSMLDKKADSFAGLVLMAAYSSESADLSSWTAPALSITATNDQILDWEKYEEAKKRLPAGTAYFDIFGGNHAGFGSYGTQKGDGEAEISREEQHRQIVELIQNFFLENGFE